MSIWRFKATHLVVVGVLALLFSVISVWAAPAGRIITTDKHKVTVADMDDLHMEIPADVGKDQITIEYADLDLTGINKPYGFIAKGKVYRFGPHGIKFAKGKEIGVHLDLKNLGSVHLYYINRETHRLELVPDQHFNPETKRLDVKLSHFSDYVPGVCASWDGGGIAPFCDYVHNGQEHMNMATLQLSIIATDYTLPGRGGLDVSLERCYYEADSESGSMNMPNFIIYDL